MARKTVTQMRLRRLRKRLVALWSLFGDHEWLVDAQNVWRGNQPGLQEAVKQQQRTLGPPFRRLPTRPTARELGDLLAELEAVDQAAWIAAGGPLAPFETFKTSTGEVCWLVPLVRKRVSRDSHQSGRIHAHMCHHVIIRAVQMDLGTSIDVLQTYGLWLEAPLGPRQVRVETMSFADEARLTFKGDPRWRGVADDLSKEREAAILDAIRSAGDAGVEILVFPELTILPRHRRPAIELLQRRTADGKPNPWITVLGSFHQRIGDRTFNTSLMVNHLGQVLGFELDRRPPWELVSHRKISALGEREVFEDAEHISVDVKLRLYATPFGITALAICKDYLDAYYGHLWQAAAPDLALVPAYGPGMRRHQRQGEDLHRQFGTISVIAHECLDSCAPEPVAPGPALQAGQEALAAPRDGQPSTAAPVPGASGTEQPGTSRAGRPEPGHSLVVESLADGTPGLEWRFKRPGDAGLGFGARFLPEAGAEAKNSRAKNSRG